jgi:2-polyprenyl-3-methyl-5-hydroxy-6-metoxy-1,4-benzoquinol methylase
LSEKPGEPVTVDPSELADSEWTPVNSCPLCASDSGKHQPFAAHPAGRETIHYVLCLRCGLVFQSPQLAQENLDRHYRHEYRQRSHSQERHPGKDRWVQERRAEHLARQVRRRRPTLRRHLDVGSSSGTLLTAFSREFGSEAFGVEPGESDRAEARTAGLQVVASIDQIPRHAAGAFDLVSLIHVLEHLPDPVAVLRLIRREWLAADGLVLVETPNLYGHTSFELGHLAAYSEQTLRGALSAAGFEIVELHRHGKPYSRLLPLFLLAIARPAPSGSQPALRPPRPAWVHFRRWLGLTRLRLARLAARLMLGGRGLQPWAD